MSIHYLISPFTPNGDIIDVVTSETGQTESTGATIVRVPDGVAILNDPTNLNDLITSKYAGLLAFYAGFPDILADPCLDVLTVDVPNSSGVIVSSGFVNHSIQPIPPPPPGYLVSTVFPLGSVPTQCVVVWEEYRFTDLDDKNQRLRRTYVEESGSNLLCIVSFNGGVTSNIVSNGTVFNIPVPDQGAAFTIGLANVTPSRLHLGSWALIY
jgi:hypothetical protein